MPEADGLRGARVLIVLNELDLGGAERQALGLGVYLRDECDAEVQIWGFSNRGAVVAQCDRLGLQWRLVSNGRDVSGVSPRVRGLGCLTEEVRAYGPDVLLPFTTIPNVDIGAIWRTTGARLAVWNQREEGRLGFAPRRHETLAVRATPLFIANSQAGAEHVRSIGAPPERVHIVPNAVRLPGSIRPGEWRTRLRLGSDDFLAVFVANFRPEKDHLTAVRAWRTVVDSLPGSVLVLAGRGGEATPSVLALIAGLGLRDSIRVLDHVDDLDGLLADADVGILTSRTEGSPNAVLEYMAAGRAVVASRIAGVTALIGDTPDQLAPPGDVAAVAARILALARDEGRRTALGRANRAGISKFEPQVVHSQYVDLLAGSLSKGRPLSFSMPVGRGLIVVASALGRAADLKRKAATTARFVQLSASVRATAQPDRGRRVIFVMPRSATGGAERAVLELVRGLRSLGVKSHVCTTLDWDHVWDAEFRAAATSVHHFASASPGGAARLISRLAATLDADAVVVANSQVGYDALALVQQRSPRTRRLDLLQGEGGRHEGGGFPLISVPYMPLLDHRVVVSEYLRSYMAGRHGEDLARVTVVPNCVDLERFDRDRLNRERAPLDRPASRFHAVFIGRLDLEKRPLLFVEAIKRARTLGVEASFAIAGDGPLGGDVSAAAEKCGGITMLGFIRDPERILLDADLLVIPSEIEGLPLVLLEAMAMGVVPICAAVGGIPEAVRDGIDGVLVDPGDDPGPYGEAIVRLAGDRELRESMASHAIDRVRTSYSRELSTEAFHDVLARTCGWSV